MTDAPPSLLKNKEFLKLWTGQSISEFGSNMGAMWLLPLLVLHATPMQMGWLAALEYTPVLLMGLFAGAWVDRLQRRPIMMAADIGRAVLLVTLPIAYWMGLLQMAQVYVTVTLVGALNVIFNVAYPAYLPSLVAKENLMEGNGKLGMSRSIAHMAGTSIGFSVVQWVGAPLAVVFDAFTFLISVLSLGLVRKPERKPTPTEDRQHIVEEIKAGMKIVLGHPILRPLILCDAMQRFFGFFFAALYSLYAIRVLKISPSLLGIVIAVGGLGAFFGAYLSERTARRIPLGLLLIGAVVLDGLLMLLTPLAFGPPFVAAICLMIPQFFGDALMITYEVTETSLRQKVLPERFLGRANASIQFLIGGMGPLGALVGGALGERFGSRMALLVAVLGYLVATLWVIFSPVRRLKGWDSPDLASLDLNVLPDEPEPQRV
jgi:predicted MFS family arabinose efflux permease